MVLGVTGIVEHSIGSVLVPCLAVKRLYTKTNHRPRLLFKAQRVKFKDHECVGGAEDCMRVACMARPGARAGCNDGGVARSVSKQREKSEV